MDRTKTNYVNEATAEITTEQTEAMEWYRNGDNISVWSWSETLQEMVERVTWVH